MVSCGGPSLHSYPEAKRTAHDKTNQASWLCDHKFVGADVNPCRSIVIAVENTRIANDICCQRGCCGIVSLVDAE
jgi:hypothetical protein